VKAIAKLKTYKASEADSGKRAIANAEIQRLYGEMEDELWIGFVSRTAALSQLVGALRSVISDVGGVKTVESELGQLSQFVDQVAEIINPITGAIS